MNKYKEENPEGYLIFCILSFIAVYLISLLCVIAIGAIIGTFRDETTFLIHIIMAIPVAVVTSIVTSHKKNKKINKKCEMYVHYNSMEDPLYREAYFELEREFPGLNKENEIRRYDE